MSGFDRFVKQAETSSATATPASGFDRFTQGASPEPDQQPLSKPLWQDINMSPYEPSSKASYLLKGIPGYDREGFLENLKNPVDVLLRENAFVNLYRSYRQGTFQKDFKDLVRSGKDLLTKEGMQALWSEAKRDPGGFAAQFANSLVADPYLAVAPMGLGGKVARPLANVAGRIGPVTGKVVGGAGRMAEAGLVGGSINAGVNAAQQLSDKGFIDTGELEQQAVLGGATAAPFGLLVRNGKVPNTRKPLGEEPAGGRAPEPEAPTGPEFTPETYGVSPDQFYNAAEQAYTLLQKGGSTAEVRRVRQKNPLVGRILDDMDARRRMARDAMKETLQGEVLPPEGEMPAGRPALPSAWSSELPQLPSPDAPTAGGPRQLGRADPELLARMAAAGGMAAAGATLTPEEPWKGALGGAAASLAPRVLAAGLGELAEHPSGGRSSQIGAVKAPGGMWHPQAAENLSRPFSLALIANKPVNEAKPLLNWATRVTQTYLNRYAGTERDPLKDIEIPFGTGTKRWEDVTDALVTSTRADTLRDQAQRGLTAAIPEQIPAAEAIWRADPLAQPVDKYGTAQTALTSIKSYLAHVGDYLRQNVPPEKLNQYDLTRAVRETAANDARMAKQMEKAAAAEMAQLPVHKEYPDGFRWVELKAPEKLTPEQMRGVRSFTYEELRKQGMSKEDIEDIRDQLGDHPDPDDVAELLGAEPGEVKGGYFPVDAEGKHITNAFTGQEASGRTPEEAWLAGQLAREGNQMGHCVGGYCEEVASGQSKIYSLRDPKGKSHVTVEVATPDVRSNRLLDYEQDSRIRERARELGNGELNEELYLQAARELFPALHRTDILQIKGKQNRAPNPEYLPYVQDFVRSGEWGDVGDLDHTRLLRHENSYVTPEEALPQAISNLENAMQHGPYPVTPGGVRADTVLSDLKRAKAAFEEGDLAGYDGTYALSWALNLRKGPGFSQRGSIDPELLKKMGVIGGAGALGAAIGAALNREEPFKGGLMGAIAGAILTAPSARQGLDHAFGLVSTRITEISPVIHRQMNKFEHLISERTHAEIGKGDPFWRRLHRLRNVEGAEELNSAILTNDPPKVEKLLRQFGDAELLAEWKQMQAGLRGLGEEAQGLGRFRQLLPGYFPRIVKDYEGLLGKLEGKERETLREAVDAANAKAMNSRGTPLTEVERSDIVNNLLFPHKGRVQQPGFTRPRSVEEVTKDLLPFYYKPVEAYHTYVRSVVEDLEKARLLGKHRVEVKKDGRSYLDNNQSIQNWVADESKRLELSFEKEQELKELLQARLNGPGKAMWGWLQDARNLSYMSLLGSPGAALMQGADLATPLYRYGVRDTLAGVAQRLTGKTKVSAEELGLADHLSEEFAGQRWSTRALNKVFKPMFQVVDMFAKDALTGAALNHYQRLAQSAKGMTELRARFGEAWGQDFEPLLQELRTKEVGPRSRELAWSELSHVQPISRLEVPEAYLRDPNLRALYQMKTFMMKQMDITRRDAFNQIAKGGTDNVAKGTYNLARYAAIMGMSGATFGEVRDFLNGKDFDIKATDFVENILKTYGLNEHLRKKVAEGKPLHAVGEMFVPPAVVFDKAFSGKPEAVRLVPWIGDPLYFHALGGKEKAAAKEEKQSRLDQTEDLRAFNRAMRKLKEESR